MNAKEYGKKSWPTDQWDQLFNTAATCLAGGAPFRSMTVSESLTQTGNRMTTTEYLAAIDKLGLRPASRATASALGLSLRQCQRIAAGQAPVSRTLELLLKNLIAVRAVDDLMSHQDD